MIFIYPDDRRYTKDHEWVLVTGPEEATVGITKYAQEALGDVVYVELPAAGNELRQGESLGVVESVKAVSDIYCPVDGAVLAVNEALPDAPELLNEDPHDTGWIVRLKLTRPQQIEQLMTSAEYDSYLKNQS